MKHILYFAALILFILLTGCSIDLDYSTSKLDKFTAETEALANEFVEAEDELRNLNDKNSFTEEDQKLIVQQIEDIKTVITDFESTEAPYLAEKAKKVAVKELNKREEVFNEVQEKAKEGTATKEDVEAVIELLTDDINIKLLD